MMACTSCGAKVDGTPRACPRCGASLAQAAADLGAIDVPELELPGGEPAGASAKPSSPPRRMSSARPGPPLAAAGLTPAGGGRELDDALALGSADLGPIELDVPHAPPPPSFAGGAVSTAALPASQNAPVAAVSNPRLAGAEGPPAGGAAESAVAMPSIDPREARAYAGYEETPAGFWTWPAYALRVTRRRVAIARELEAMRRAFPLLAPGPAAEDQRRRIAVAEAALEAHDARAFVGGWVIGAASVSLLVMVVLFPFLFRLFVHVDPPPLVPPPHR